MATKTVTPPTASDVRTWLREQDSTRTVPSRGRLSAADIEAFNADKANKRNPYSVTSKTVDSAAE